MREGNVLQPQLNVPDGHCLELGKTNPSWNREEHLGDFRRWLHADGVDTSKFDISSFDNYGLGLKAKEDLPVSPFILHDSFRFLQSHFRSITAS